MQIQLTAKEQEATRYLCAALDTETPYEAEDLLKEVSGLVAYSKVNSVFTQASAYGFPVVARLHEINPRRDGGVILDTKTHDTPSSTYHTIKGLSKILGVSMITVHTAGGEEMCRMAVRGAEDGAADLKRVGKYDFYNQERPKIIGVTVLTSEDDTSLRAQGYRLNYHDLVILRAEWAKNSGLDGVVCSSDMVDDIEREFGPGFIYLLTGMEWNGIKGKDQKHPYLPQDAIRKNRNCLLVAGSALRMAKNRRETIYEIVKAVATELKSTPS